jgi:hypothetical protein
MFFLDRQTESNGLVWYGRPITYGWIAEQLDGFSERRLRDWNQRLQRERYIAVQLVMYGGMRIQILRPKKFAAQLPMFPRVENPVDNPVENLRVSLSLRRRKTVSSFTENRRTKDTGSGLEKRKSSPIEYDRDGDRQGRLEFLNLLRELAQRKAV